MNIRTILATLLLVTKTVMYAGNPVPSCPALGAEAPPVMRPRSISPVVLLRLKDTPNENEGTHVFKKRHRSMSQETPVRPVSPSTFDEELSIDGRNNSQGDE